MPTSALASTRPTASWPLRFRSGSRRSTAPARPTRSGARSLTAFDSLPEQGEAKRLLAVALAAELLGGDPRVERRTHPDLYVLEPLGDQIRIDAVRELRRDLHMRPFEADRRIYLVFGADLMNEDAADALLKDLEEPPPYAVLVLVANDLGPLPETIRSRCQLVPFRRLSERAVREEIGRRAPGRRRRSRDSTCRRARPSSGCGAPSGGRSARRSWRRWRSLRRGTATWSSPAWARRAPSSTRIDSTSCGRTRRRSGSPEPSARASSCARPGGTPRNCKSTRASRSRR